VTTIGTQQQLRRICIIDNVNVNVTGTGTGTGADGASCRFIGKPLLQVSFRRIVFKTCNTSNNADE